MMGVVSLPDLSNPSRDKPHCTTPSAVASMDCEIIPTASTSSYIYRLLFKPTQL